MPDSPPTRPALRRWHRWTLIVCGVLAIVLTLWFMDDSLEPADDLMPPEAHVPWDETNGWKLTLEMEESRYPYTLLPEWDQLGDIVTKQKELDQVDFSKLVLPEADLARLESLVAMPLFRNRLESAQKAEMFSSGRGFPGISRYVRAGAYAALQKKNWPEFMRHLRLDAALSRRCARGATSMGNFFGASWGTIPPFMAMHLLELSEPELLELAELYKEEPFSTDELRQAMLHEFRLDRMVLAAAKKPPGLERDAMASWYFRPKQTQNLHARQARDWQRMAGTAPWGEISVYMEHQMTQGSLAFLDPNSAGKACLNTTFFNAGTLELLIREDLARHRGLQVLIALHRSRRAGRNPPASLAELVPAFLPAVPRDPFDFQPLRWDAKERVVYSYWSNGKSLIPPEMYGVSNTKGWKRLTVGTALRFRHHSEGPDATPARRKPAAQP